MNTDTLELFADGAAGSVPVGKGWIFLVTDAVALAGGFLLATLLISSIGPIIGGAAPAAPSLADQLNRSGHVGLLSLSLLFWFAASGHYSQRLTLLSELERVASGVAIIGLVDGYLQFVYRQDVSRSWVILNWLLGLGLILSFRIAGKHALHRLGLWCCPTIVIGTADRAREIADTLRSDQHLGYVPCALVDVESGPKHVLDRVRDLLAGGHARHVVVSFADAEIVRTLEIARILDERFEVSMSLVPNLRGLSICDLRVDHVFGHDVLFLNSSRRSHSRARMAAKRLFDVVVAGLLVVLAAPVMVIIAGLVRLDGGPALYGSTRIGRGGQIFKALKFRSMVPDADRALQELIAREPAVRQAWSRQFKLKDDPRVTWIGGYLRRTSLDELPQLFNVLRGHMSLVGPRPLLPEERERYDRAAFALYRRATPGLTGMWQVSGRDDLEYYRRIELNNWYVRNWSPSLDVFILIKTALMLVPRSPGR